MPFSEYNSDGVRLLSAALCDALELVRRASGQPETSAITNRLVENLKETHDSGERDPKALKRAAVQGIFG